MLNLYITFKDSGKNAWLEVSEKQAQDLIYHYLTVDFENVVSFEKIYL